MTTSRGKKNLRFFESSPGSWMTVLLFQLFDLPCLFCARLCRSCLDDLKIFDYEQKLRSTQHPHTNADNRASDFLTMQTRSQTDYNWLRLAIQAEMYTAQLTQHTRVWFKVGVFRWENSFSKQEELYIKSPNHMIGWHKPFVDILCRILANLKKVYVSLNKDC